MSRSMWIAAVVASCFLVACDGDGPGGGDGGAGRDASAPDAGGSDGGGAGSDAGSDAGEPGDTCVGEADGFVCGSGLICISEACVSSTCGDGYVDTDASEECDDGNDVAFDGCEPSTCVFTCTMDTECDDGRACNGVETCNPDMHVCQLGTDPDDGTVCDRTGTGDGVCRGDDCVAPGCGNSVVDSGEQCDDGNELDGDGCEGDCTFSCEGDIDCADGDVCNGEETCETVSHVCQAGTPLDCADGDDCTSDVCDPVAGCTNPLIDADGDGHASDTLGVCGDDCDDSRADVYTGAEEQCDAIDHDCDSVAAEGVPTWYVDCDEDGYATDTTGAQTGCDMPAPVGVCGWTLTRPVDMSNTDCHDGNADVHPGQTRYFDATYTTVDGDRSFDYNCDGTDSRRYGCGTRCGFGCRGGGFTSRTSSNPNGCLTLCSGRTCSSTSPACGASADYVSCRFVIGGRCGPSRPYSRTQACH